MIILANKVQQRKNKGIKHLFEGELAVDFIPLILGFHYEPAVRPPTIGTFLSFSFLLRKTIHLPTTKDPRSSTVA
jgi:hypothetical protein